MKRLGPIIEEGVDQMMKLNLLGGLSDPLVSKPDKEKAQKSWSDTDSVDPWQLGGSDWWCEVEDTNLKTITYCSCGKHPVNPKKDVYTQHNHWLQQQLGGPVEITTSQLHKVRGIGPSVEKYVPTYDFSGEDFEMSPSELRKFRDEQEK